MGTQPAPVLDESDLNDTDKRLLDLLHDGRITPQYAADELEISRTYSSERLKRLVEHGHVDRVAGGLYGLANDPRGDELTDLKNEQELRDKMHEWKNRWHNTQRELEGVKSELEDARQDSSIDVQAARAALDELEAACERGDGPAVQEAIQRLREVLTDE